MLLEARPEQAAATVSAMADLDNAAADIGSPPASRSSTTERPSSGSMTRASAESSCSGRTRDPLQ